MKPIILTIGVAAVLVWGQSGWAQPDGGERLTLDQARVMAWAQHPQVAVAREQAAAAREVTKEAQAGYFPQLYAYGTAAGAEEQTTRLLAGGINNPSVYDRLAGGLGVSQLLTDFGRTANLTASARYAALAAAQNVVDARARVRLQVDTAYLAALEAQAVQRVAGQTLATRQLLLEQVSTLATNKLRSALDVSFARVALEEGRLLVQKSDHDAEAAMAGLVAALGSPHYVAYQLVEPVDLAGMVTNAVEDLVQEAMSQRPELLRFRAQEEAARRRARAEQDARLPTVSAVGFAGGAPQHDSRLSGSYAAGAVQLSLPLFAGGLYVARQREAEQQAQAVADERRSEENTIIRDVRVAWLNLNNAVAEWHTTDELVHEAAEAYELADARYRAGLGSIVEYSQAQLALTTAQIDQVDARYAVRIQRSVLEFQTGENTR